MTVFTIRSASQNDQVQLAGLAGELGYPSSPEQVSIRLARVIARPDQAIFVAETQGQITGWVHVYACPTVESDLYAEIGGLVVSKEWRGKGAGRALMSMAEAWAHDLGIHEVRLRSNIIRSEAHRFYEAIGYTKTKSQFTFRKAITQEIPQA